MDIKFHDHSTRFNKIFSVTQGRETLATAKPFAPIRGWWTLRINNASWINPQARDINIIRKQMGYKGGLEESLYNELPSYLLIKGIANARREMMALAAIAEKDKS